MKNEFVLSAVIPASPSEIYKAWLSTKGHTLMTGSPARVVGKVGGKFTAWDGYISGRTLELELDQRIVQACRTSEFPVEVPDYRLEVLLAKVKSGTRITFIHTNLPDDQAASYKLGWKDFYFSR